jgi:Protein of unknown function (DUF3050)
VNVHSLPKNFVTLPRYAELMRLVDEITDHPAMRVATPHCQENMMRASLAFTVCFNANLAACVKGALEQRHPLIVRRDTSLLHLFLELAGEELATDNLPLGQAEAFSPHFVPMYEAALEAGIDVSAIDRLMASLEAGQPLTEALNELGVEPRLAAYLEYSAQCAERFEDAFATIALRELTLSANFRVILNSLPEEGRFAKYRLFLSGHVELDEGGHAFLMAAALESVSDPKGMLDVMIEFYTSRKAVYDACLDERNLF